MKVRFFFLKAKFQLSDLTIATYTSFLMRPVMLVAPQVVVITGAINIVGIEYAIVAIAIFAAMKAWTIYSMMICFISRYASIADNYFSSFVHSPHGLLLTVIIGEESFAYTKNNTPSYGLNHYQVLVKA